MAGVPTQIVARRDGRQASSRVEHHARCARVARVRHIADDWVATAERGTPSWWRRRPGHHQQLRDGLSVRRCARCTYRSARAVRLARQPGWPSTAMRKPCGSDIVANARRAREVVSSPWRHEEIELGGEALLEELPALPAAFLLSATQTPDVA